VEAVDPQKTPPQRSSAKKWAELLARVFGIDMRTCPDCGGPWKIIAAILEPAAIKTILTHLRLPDKPPDLAPARIPEQIQLDFPRQICFIFPIHSNRSYRFPLYTAFQKPLQLGRALVGNERS
jgi:hypothetical protein